MPTILHIASSSNLKSSVTRKIGSVVINDAIAKKPETTIIERDLVKSSIPHIDPSFLGAMMSGDEERLKLSTELIDELIASDTIVLEAPMYNFTIPSVLKAWIDHIARAGKTFEYSQEGPKGLLQGKKAILILGRGGIYSEGPSKAMDFQEPYLRAVFGFLGINDIEVIYIEGVSMGEEASEKALAKAQERSHELFS